MRTLVFAAASIAAMAIAPAAVMARAAPKAHHWSETSQQWAQNYAKDYASDRDVVCKGAAALRGADGQAGCAVLPTSTSKFGISETGSSGSRGHPSVPVR